MTHAALPEPGVRAFRLPRDTLGLRLALGLVAVLTAYHYSLLTLVRNLGLDTPLAYLGLVPLIALGLAVLQPRRSAGPDIHDRQLDLIVGLPLVVGTVVALHVLPQRLSTVFWTSRLDLLTLPFFVLGVGVLLFGLRATWAYRVPVAFLLLAWPLPYTLLIDHALDLTTRSTIDALRQVLTVVHVAVPAAAGGTDGSLFVVPHHGAAGTFTVSIASACAGVNSLVGFVIVGTAFLAVVRLRPSLVRTGSHGLLRKGLWLLLGLGIVWVLNLVRLLIVLGAGKAWGKGVAIDGLHPVIGLFTFSVGVLAALLVMPLFGLETPARPQAATGRRETAARRARRAARSRPTAARGLRLSLVTVLASATVLAGADSAFAHYELVASDLSSLRLVGFAQEPAPVPGFTSLPTDHFDWVKQFFGSDATWDRYQYTWSGSVLAASLRHPVQAAPAWPVSFTSRRVVVDAIQGTSLSSFNAYGIEACYQFHGYRPTEQQRVDLGHGVFGSTVSFREPDTGVAYNVVWWVWPVQTPHGKRYERVALLQEQGAPAQAEDGAGVTPDSNPFKGVGAAAPVGPAASKDPSAVAERGVLTRFAQAVVAGQPDAPQTDRTTVQ